MTEGRRSYLDQTADLIPYHFGCRRPLTGGPHPSGGLNRYPARAVPGVGRPSVDPPRTAKIPARSYFFRQTNLLLRFYLLDSKIHQIFSNYAN
jgi:hypothetical protein